MKVWFKPLFFINSVSLTLGTILAVILLFRSQVPVFELIELKTYDLRFLSRGQMPPSPAVVLVLIDEKSLDAEGRWPWPRSKFATLVDILSRGGAKVIGFDVGFLEPDENSQLELLNQLSQTVKTLAIKNARLAKFIQESKRNADNDLVLAQAIKKSSAAIVLGYFFHQSESDLGYQIEQQNREQRLERLSTSKYPLVTYTKPGLEVVARDMSAYAPEPNLAILTEAAASSGYFNLRTDMDGVVRWMPLMIVGGEDLFPPLSVLCAWHYLGKPSLKVKIDPYGAVGVQMGDRFIPTDETGRLLINYLGPAKTFPHFSISEVLSGKLANGTFADKIVLVGSTAMGAHDLRSTPFTSLSPLYAGVEIHASVIDNILSEQFVTNPGWSKVYSIFAIIILGGLIGIAVSYLSPLKGLICALVLGIVHIFIARWLFINAGVWLNIVYPLLVLSANYTLLSVYDYVTEEQERKRIKEAFTHYVAPVVIEEMLKDPGRLKLGGEEKILTVVFSDLQGFTATSERYAPHEMIEILNEYYTRMTEQIFVYEGMLKEYVGDELMAIFGAPIEQLDHAERACAAALAMQEQRKALSEEWAQAGRPPLVARTGVNSGLMLVGNLGSRYRFAYGALGDHVNLASRLEGLNKVYKTQILIGENTAQMVEKSFVLREIDTVQVVGREQAVGIYELLAKAGTSLPAEQEQAFRLYAAGLEAYRERRWYEAVALFNEVLTLWPGDGPSRIMADRCLTYQKTPPPEEWGSVFEATHK
jgi:adenylate cyclase